MADQVMGDLKQQTLMEIWQDPRSEVFSCREDRGDHCAVCDFRAYCSDCRARAVSYLDDVQAGDPGCVYNQHAWNEGLQKARAQNEFVILGQHDRVDSFLAGATDGPLTTTNTERLVQDMLTTISDSLDGSGV